MGLRRKPPIRSDKGRIRVDLDAEERALLTRLAGEMEALLADPQRSAAVTRLFPVAYPDDPDAESFYRLMAGEQLATRHREAMEVLAAAMATELLDEAQAMGLMRALNQMRLVIGTQLGIESDDDDLDLDPDHPAAPMVSLYHWLGWLLELTIEALSA